LQEAVDIYRDVGHRLMLSVSLACLAIASRGLGQIPRARKSLGEALLTATDIWARLPLLLVLPSIALILVDQGEAERAAEVYALASRYPFVANSSWFEDVVGKHIAAAAAGLPPEVAAAAQERGTSSDLRETVTKLLGELTETSKV
jgi:hypothetical protein